MAASGEFSAQLAPADLSRLLRDTKAFDDAFYKATRKRLRAAGQEGVKDVQRRLVTATSHSNTGLRKGLAAGTKVSIRTGARTAGVTITTTGAKLPAGKQPMVKAYNQASIRHPVYGNRSVWVDQRGRPYFGSVLDQRKRDMQTAVESALRDAAETISGGHVG